MSKIKEKDGTEIFYKDGVQVRRSYSTMAGHYLPMTGMHKCSSSLPTTEHETINRDLLAWIKS